VLKSIRGRGLAEQSKTISVDAMAVVYLKGETEDYIGALAASKCHEVVVYEDKGSPL
jgi:hypothetical protein